MTIHGEIGHLHEDIKKRKRMKMRLGRHIHHDPRSEAFRVRFAPEHAQAPLVSKRWTRMIPVLNQGQLGSCTGNAATGLIGTAPYHDLPAVKPLVLDENYAIGLYEAETRIDNIRGAYPPDDTGSTGLAACKVLHTRGVIPAYHHCINVDDVLRHLSFKGPVILGMSWLAKMDTPNKAGVVRYAGNVEGGHEVCVDEIDVTRKLIGITNSWGTRWGVKGRFFLSFADLEKAFRDGADAMTVGTVEQG